MDANMAKLAQQDFLRNAMRHLNLTRQKFADRIGASKRALDNWLLPTDSKGFRPMPETVWMLIREILR
jgi:aspartate carbamoyltransferase catalytic subunit